MAEHLVQRFIALNPKTQPFLFNEKTKTLQDMIATLRAFLIANGKGGEVALADGFEKGMEKFTHLLAAVATIRQPLFVFDNLEDFQSAPGEAFKPEYHDLAEVLHLLCDSKTYPLILTGRYPLPDFPNVQSFDLNQVSLNDFWKKCHYLEIGQLHENLLKAELEKRQKAAPEKAALEFIDVVKLLHRTFGGNYRALEFFNELFNADPEKIRHSLDTLESFQQKYAGEQEQVLQRMSGNLLFEQLLALLTPQQRELLALLREFRTPVLLFALELSAKADPPRLTDGQAGGQNAAPLAAAELEAALLKLNELTLVEISLDLETRKLCYYYATPLVKDLLAAHQPTQPEARFSHQQAGIYHYHVYQNIEASLTELEEAFYHFHLAGDKEKVQTIGDELSGLYHAYSLYQSAFYYAAQVYELLGEATSNAVLNRLGLICDTFGKYDAALKFYEKARAGYKQIGDKSGEGTTLNNISQIYDARGDYDTALSYLEQSLKIRQEIGDKSGEGVTLNNISQIFRARGDYDTALRYLEQSLKIFQEGGNKYEVGTTLNNISQIFKARGDYDTALRYLEQSLKIRQEIGDKKGESVTLNNISQISQARGDYDTALRYSEQDLKICQEIGDKSGEGTTLNNISQIYSARGDYDTALKYLEQSLKISQEIGDKSGEGYTLHNMAMIAQQKQDYQKTFEYEAAAYQLLAETGDANGLYQVGIEFGQMVYAVGEKKEGLAILQRSYQIGVQAGYPDVAQVAEILKQMKGQSPPARDRTNKSPLAKGDLGGCPETGGTKNTTP